MVQNQSKHNGWKQPTPTDINFVRNLTAVERSVFREILSLCQNDSYLCHFDHAGRHYSIELKRGQCIFKVANFADDFGIHRKKIHRSLKNIEKWYTRMDIRGMPYGTVVTLLNYDEIVKMDISGDNRGTIEGQLTRVLKSIKSKEILKKDKEIDIYVSEFNKLFSKSYRVTRGREEKLKLRLKNFSMDQILIALKNMASNNFYKGDNDRCWMADPDFLIRSDEQVDKFLNTATTQKKRVGIDKYGQPIYE